MRCFVPSGIALAIGLAGAVACQQLGGLSGGVTVVGDDGGTPISETGAPVPDVASPDTAPACTADTTSDVDNCGSCGHVCPARTNGSPVCKAGACALACAAGFANCDADDTNGCEIRLDDDPQNCGACGRSCLGTACTKGACGVTNIVGPFDTPTGLALDATNVYWTSSSGTGGVFKCPRDGCTAATKLYDAAGANALALQGTTLLWGGNQLTRGTIAGDPSASIYASGVWGIVVDTTYAYVNDPFGVLVARVPLAGPDAGAPVYLSNDDGFSSAIAIDQGYVYFSLGGTSNLYGIARCPSGGGAYQVLLTLPQTARPSSIVVDGTSVYFADAAAGAVRKLPKTGLADGGAPTDLLLGLASPQRIASDGANLFVTEQGGGRVLAVPLAGGASVVLASGQASPTELALDATWVYWTNHAATGGIARVPK